jgi:membrane-bound lytic murein transglycosylase A
LAGAGGWRRLGGMRAFLVLLTLAGSAAADPCDDLPLTPLAEAIEQRLQAGGADRKQTAALSAVARLARAGDRERLCRELPSLFKLVPAASGAEFLVTAYNAPTVRGSRVRTDEFRHPIHRRPADLTKCPDGTYGRMVGARCVGYATCGEILKGSLDGKGLELVWLADAYDALAVHIEGGAHVVFPDGSSIAIGVDGHNSLPYTNVTRLLEAEGKLPAGDFSLTRPGSPRARAYFDAHPEELAVWWAKNPRYIFFKETQTGGEGRHGPLTAGRSIAVDAKVIPIGSLVLLQTQKPLAKDGKITGWESFSRVVVAEDSGAAIKGPRIDLFYGDDELAQIASSGAKAPGHAFLLVPR